MFAKVTYVLLLTQLCMIFGYQITKHEESLIKKNDENLHVKLGETIMLHCKSNDQNHNFMFWHFTSTGEVIGPRNIFNDHKFKYEVLTGNLTIKAVNENDTGTYSCVSDGVDKRDISVHSINLLINNGWAGIINEKNQQVPRNAGGNLWIVSAILGTVFVLLIIILVGLHFYNKEAEKPKYFDIVEQNDDDEDSTEELFTREPSTSGVKKVAEKNKTSDNFEKVYTTINVNKI